MNALNQITPRAFDAIVSQIRSNSDRHLTVWEDMDWEVGQWTAFFEDDDDPQGGMNEYHEVCAWTRCRLVGAYDSECNRAANRDELLALLGEAVVTRWEAYAEERANG